MSKDCIISVRNGRYECDGNLLRVTSNKKITAVNLPADIAIQVSIGGHTDGPWSEFQAMLTNGTTYLPPGLYWFDFDCDDYEGEAPEVDPVEVCCVDVTDEEYFCAKIAEAVAGNASVTLDPASIDAIKACLASPEGSAIEKLCDIVDLLGEDSVLCKKLLSILDSLGSGDISSLLIKLLDCMQQVKANTAAITGIETAFGQLGCIYAEGVQIGSVLVCKVSPEDGGEPVTQVHAYYTDGTVDTAYTGAWEPCTNLNNLELLLGQILACFEEQKEATSLDDFKVVKSSGPEGDYTSAVRLYADRPNAAASWAICQQDETPIAGLSGVDLADFRANATAAGYTIFDSGVGDAWLCPCPPIAEEVLFLKINGEPSNKLQCTPIETIEGAPAKVLAASVCALRTIGCNDDRRDDILVGILDAITELKGCISGECEPTKSVDSNNLGNL